MAASKSPRSSQTQRCRAGLRAGDIILQFNYEDVGVSPRDLAKRIAKVSPGDIVSVLVRREHRRIFMAFPR